ncbi:MAG: Type 1 glutamine amidotransferase-like domain-containing protein [Candidatus Beckwithbacteria bacterium]
MKLLLTSAGLVNQPIVDALGSLVQKPFSALNLTFIPTAANVVPGSKDWLIDDLYNCKKLGFKQVDIMDIAAVAKDIWLPRLKLADILFFGGGNTHYLMNWVKNSGLQALLPEWLTTRVYLGLSAGSEITCKARSDKYNADLFNKSSSGEKYSCLGLVNFHILPHLNSVDFPNCRLENIQPLAEEIKETIYALDDNSAVKVDGKNIEVISAGKWQKFN